MSDVRLDKIEAEVVALKVANASLVTAVEHLSDTLAKLDRTVDDLRDAMNRGRGALWVIVGASTFLGGAISAGVQKLLER